MFASKEAQPSKSESISLPKPNLSLPKQSDKLIAPTKAVSSAFGFTSSAPKVQSRKDDDYAEVLN